MGSARRLRPRGDLGACPSCGSCLVQLVGCDSAASVGYHRLALDCPECAWMTEGVYSDLELDRLWLLRERGFEALRSALKALERKSMEDDLRLFRKALELDLITADDFSRRMSEDG